MEITETLKRNWNIFKRSIKRSKPIEFPALYLGINNSCTRKCNHCYYGIENEEKMDLGLIENLLDFSLKNNVFSVIWAGKEPLIDFDNSIKPFILNQKYKNIYFMFHTNGDLLTKEVANVLDEADNCLVDLSLDGIKCEQHDKAKGNGSYEKTMHTVHLLQERNIPYGFFVTITKENFHQMNDTVKYAIDLGALCVQIIGYKAIGPKANLNKILTAEQESERYDKKDQIKKEFSYLSVPHAGCNLGVDPEGYFSYCPFLINNVGGNKITANTSHNKILSMFRESKEKFNKLSKNIEECPLIENTTKVSKFIQENEYKTNWDDMLKEGTIIYKKAVKIADEFKTLRKKEK